MNDVGATLAVIAGIAGMVVAYSCCGLLGWASWRAVRGKFRRKGPG